jgi:thiol-disulfide isomerase/thioredoxin
MKTLLVLNPTVAAALTVAASLLLAAAPAVRAADVVGQPAAAFTLPARGGGAPVTLAALRGQVVMVNFWASWCGPCREEFPLLDQMYAKYRPMGFTLLGVNVEPDAKNAEGVLAKTPVRFPILLDRDNSLSKLYRIDGMPSTVLIDRNGVVRWTHRGYKSGDENEYLDQLRALLREK